MAFIFDCDDNLIHVTFIVKAWGAVTDCVGIVSPELLSPFAHRLAGNNDPAVSKYVFNHAKAERKAEL